MSRALTPLVGAAALAGWLRAGGRPTRRSFGQAARLRWGTYWFERNWRTSVARLDGAGLPEDPVFILGIWRSGTTVLHELVTACTQWATPRTWQCFNPSTCFLTAAPSQVATVGRPMDHGQIATHSPQEDEFALLLLGEFSAYRGFIDPRRLGECAAELSSSRDAKLPRWQDFLRGVCSQADTKRLLLKSPGHTFRVPMLRANFPRAKFIWIGRHTGEVLASNLKMWKAMIERYALWECPPGAIDDFLQQSLRAYASVLEQCLDLIPREQLLWVDFDELRTDPRRLLRRVLHFIETPADSDPETNIDRALTRLTVYAGARASMPVSHDVERVEQRIQAARQRFSHAC